MNQKGFTSPLIMFLLTSGILLAGFWLFTNDINVSSSSEVHGVSTLSTNSKPGLSVSVISGSTWDLFEYLCVTKEECIQGLNSGKRWGTVSGGATTLHSVEIEASPEWKNYSYIKFFVRSGGQNNPQVFKVLGVGDVPGSTKISVSDAGVVHEAVVIPLKEISTKYFKSATFTD